MLSWKEALAILETRDLKGLPVPFALSFCTADEGRGTGGEIIHYDRAIWHVTSGRVRVDTPAKQAPNGNARSKNERWTRRIRAVDSDQIRQVHLHLILSINGQAVR